MPRPDATAGAAAAAGDFRSVLRQKALKHSQFYMRLYGDGARAARADAGSVTARAPASGRSSRRVCDLVRNFEPGPMQYLRPPRPGSPVDDIASSDDEDRAAVRRRSRDLSDDSAVELEREPAPPSLRRHSTPRVRSPPPPADSPGRRERTLVEAHVVQLGRRGSEGEAARGRCVRTPSVVVSDYCDSSAAGATKEEVAWLRALSADSACSSSSTLSSRDEDFLDRPIPIVPNKMG